MFHFHKNKKTQRGVTLTELLIAITIAVIVVGMGFKIYLSSKQIYRSNRTSTVADVRELSAKKIIYDAVTNSGLSCKYGAKTQKYINRTGDFETKDDFVYDGSTIRVGNISQVGDYIRRSLKGSCEGICYQPNSDFIMLKKEDSFARLAVAPVNLTLKLDKRVSWQQGDYLALCNNDDVDVVKVEKNNNNDQLNDIRLAATPYSEYGKGDYVGKFDVNIFYIGDTGEKDKQGNRLYSLNLFTNNSNTSSSYALIDGVSDLKVSYAFINNKNLHWRNVDKTIDIDKTDYQALKVSFKVNGNKFERVILL
ncbi:prepilin-type N-terminal cleavage/methylation domain-containing protein [Francisellaceae bacterium CB299]|jgi:prepilin-type N-terminal cleavage/methylation domain-containing protein